VKQKRGLREVTNTIPQQILKAKITNVEDVKNNSNMMGGLKRKPLGNLKNVEVEMLKASNSLSAPKVKQNLKPVTEARSSMKINAVQDDDPIDHYYLPRSENFEDNNDVLEFMWPSNLTAECFPVSFFDRMCHNFSLDSEIKIMEDPRPLNLIDLNDLMKELEL